MEFEDITKYGILFIVIAVLIGTSVIMLGNISNNLATPTSFTMSNYTVTASAGTTQNFNQTFKACSFSTMAMANRSSSTLFDAGNYTLISDNDRGCQLKFKATMSANYEGKLVYFNSTNSYYADTTASQIVDNGTSAMSNLTQYLPTLALIIMVTIIIGTVVVMFKFN
jgi:hypothetical protein